MSSSEDAQKVRDFLQSNQVGDLIDVSGELRLFLDGDLDAGELRFIRCFDYFIEINQRRVRLAFATQIAGALNNALAAFLRHLVRLRDQNLLGGGTVCYCRFLLHQSDGMYCLYVDSSPTHPYFVLAINYTLSGVFFDNAYFDGRWMNPFEVKERPTLK